MRTIKKQKIIRKRLDRRSFRLNTICEAPKLSPLRRPASSSSSHNLTCGRRTERADNGERRRVQTPLCASQQNKSCRLHFKSPLAVCRRHEHSLAVDAALKRANDEHRIVLQLHSARQTPTNTMSEANRLGERHFLAAFRIAAKVEASVSRTRPRPRLRHSTCRRLRLWTTQQQHICRLQRRRARARASRRRHHILTPITRSARVCARARMRRKRSSCARARARCVRRR